MCDPLRPWSGKCSDKNSGKVPVKLMAWLDGELPDADAAAVERHVRECTECASRAEAYRQASMAFEAYCEVCCEAALAAPTLQVSAPFAHAAARAEDGRGELAEPAISRSVAHGGGAGRGFPRRALGWAAAGAVAAVAAVAVLLLVALPRPRRDAVPGRARASAANAAGAAAPVDAAAETRARKNGPTAAVVAQGIDVHGMAAPGTAAPNVNAPNFAAPDFAAANLDAANLATTKLNGRGLGTSSLHAHNVATHSATARRGRSDPALLAAGNTHPAGVAGTQAAIAPAPSARISANVASWTPAEPAIQIAIPAAAMFPPGAVPEGLTFIADVTIAADGSAQRLRLRP
jgi:anti-sigma factor RsiW